MTNWQRKLHLHPEWDQAKDGAVSIHHLARVIAERLREMRPFGGDFEDIDEKRIDLAEEFESLAGDADCDVEDFDVLMADLYDWADTQIGGKFFDAKKVCWIDRFGPVQCEPSP